MNSLKEITPLIFDSLEVELVRKNIKHLHLRVVPPSGQVKVSAPHSMKLKTIRSFVDSKLEWIEKKQKNLRSAVDESPVEYIDGERHYFDGKPCLLQILESESKQKASLLDSNLDGLRILLEVRPGSTVEEKQSVLDSWYRQELEGKLARLLTCWEERMNVSVRKLSIRRMKTRWGSCTPGSRSIRINLDLIKKPPQCLEYILVHELAHLIEPSHNSRFYSIMDRYLPHWRLLREELNTSHSRV